VVRLRRVTGCERNPKVLAETEAEVQIRGGVEHIGMQIRIGSGRR
jgi:hypothetical protein